MVMRPRPGTPPPKIPCSACGSPDTELLSAHAPKGLLGKVVRTVLRRQWFEEGPYYKIVCKKCGHEEDVSIHF